MRLLTITSLMTGLALAVGWSGEVGEALQLEDEGLAIYGTVVRPGTREPVPGVSVRLRQRAEPFGTTGLILLASANSEGRFSFTGLDPATYWVEPVLEDYPLRYADRAVVELTESGLPPDLRVWLPQTGRIAGRITDGNGQPVSGIRVEFLTTSWRAGLRVLTEVEGTATDREGRYDVALAPGEYYLRVVGVMGTVPPRFYPGVLYAEDAVRLGVAPGVSLPSVDIVLEPVGETRLRFHLPLPEFPHDLPEWLLNPLEVVVVPVGRGVIGDLPLWVAVEALGDDTFRTAALSPGVYDVWVRYASVLTADLQWDPAVPGVISRVRVTLDGTEPDGERDLGAIPQVGRGASIPGRVSFQAASSETTGRARVPSLVLGLAEATRVLRDRQTFVMDDEFLFDGVAPGRYSLVFGPLPSGWYVRSALSGATNVLLDGLDVGSGPATPLQITIADDGGQVGGVVRDSAEALVPGAQLVLIPGSNRRGPFSRLLTASASGAYILQGVPPGEYRLLAFDLTGYASPDWEDPEFLRQYELRGELVTVDPGANMTINLEAIPYLP